MLNASPKFRQGDVLIVAIASIPPSATAMERSSRGCVLAEGTATGHAHRIQSPSAVLYRDVDPDERFLRVMGPEPVALEHEEHGTIPIPPGDYRVVIHAEYVPGELPRQVED